MNFSKRPIKLGLRTKERMGEDAVIVYTKNQFGVFDLDDYTFRIASLEENPRELLKQLMLKQKEKRLEREGK